MGRNYITENPSLLVEIIFLLFRITIFICSFAVCYFVLNINLSVLKYTAVQKSKMKYFLISLAIICLTLTYGL